MDWQPHVGMCLRGTVCTKCAQIHTDLSTMSEKAPEAMGMQVVVVHMASQAVPSTTQTHRLLGSSRRIFS